MLWNIYIYTFIFDIFPGILGGAPVPFQEVMILLGRPDI